jgi:hypothetical protein
MAELEHVAVLWSWILAETGSTFSEFKSIFSTPSEYASVSQINVDQRKSWKNLALFAFTLISGLGLCWEAILRAIWLYNRGGAPIYIPPPACREIG